MSLTTHSGEHDKQHGVEETEHAAENVLVKQRR